MVTKCHNVAVDADRCPAIEAIDPADQQHDQEQPGTRQNKLITDLGLRAKDNDEENQSSEEYECRDKKAYRPSHAAKHSGVGLKVDSRLRRLCLRTQIVRGVRNKIRRTLSPNQSLTPTSLASVIPAIG